MSPVYEDIGIQYSERQEDKKPAIKEITQGKAIENDIRTELFPGSICQPDEIKTIKL